MKRILFVLSFLVVFAGCSKVTNEDNSNMLDSYRREYTAFIQNNIPNETVSLIDTHGNPPAFVKVRAVIQSGKQSVGIKATTTPESGTSLKFAFRLNSKEYEDVYDMECVEYNNNNGNVVHITLQLNNAGQFYTETKWSNQQ